MTAVAAALLVGLAIIVWAPRARARDYAGLLAPSAQHAPTPRHETRLAGRLRRLWHEDPAELVRAWRRGRRRGDLVAGALGILEGITPALEAGLTPAAAAHVAADSLTGHHAGEVRDLVAELCAASERGEPVAPVWRHAARRSGSADLGFVAAAWHLSETTGAPLAEAVDRAAQALRQSRERRRRLDVAIAGPRATVTVLTALPLTGPLFGLACGVGPSELYLGSPIGAVSAMAGVALIWLGRWWCQRMVASATSGGSGRRPGASRSVWRG